MSNKHSDFFTELDSWYNQDEPWKGGFVSLMRAIAAKKPDIPPIGKAARPRQEPYRLGQDPTMAFAPREIASVTKEKERLKIQLYGLGVWGPQGAMPLSFTEMAYSRLSQHDSLLTNFLDIFHHRSISLLYRGWFVSQDTASLDRIDDEKFSFYVGSLVGLMPNEIIGSNLPIHARLASSSHLIREARNPEGIVGALRYYFDIPVQLKEYTKQWIMLEKNEQSQFGDSCTSLLLSEGAILGDTVQDKQHKFSLILGPLTLKQYMRFSLWGEDLPILKEWIRNFIGFEYSWDVQLILSPDEIPIATLNGGHQLGYATWLEREKQDEPISGMSFDPENY
nr:type VI secretion system baseplate subunit TssG [uncultured Moellerella sp.]